MQSNTIIPNKKIANVEKINSLMTTPSDRTVDYDVFYPVETRVKAIPINTKNAIDEIAFSELKSSLDTLSTVISSLSFNEKTNPLLPLKRAITALKQKSTIGIGDYELLLKLLNDEQKNLEKYLKKTKITEPQDLETLTQISQAWLPGLYLHSCIQIDRKKIQNILFPVSPGELVAHPVKETSVKVKLEAAKAIDQLRNLEAEQALPAVLAILHEIHALTLEFPNYTKTLEAIQYAIKILSDGNEKLYVAIGDIYRVLGELKTKMIPDLEVLVAKLKDLDTHETLLNHGIELVAWLDGLYAHVYYPPSRGFAKRAQEALKEGAFTTATGLTKKDIAIYYHKGANALRDCIASFENERKNASNISTSQSPEAHAKPSQEPTKADNLTSSVPSTPEQNLTNGLATLIAPQKITFKVSPDIELHVKTNNPELVTAIAELNTPKSLQRLNRFFHGEGDGIQDDIKKSKKYCDAVELKIWLLLDEMRFCADQLKIDALYNALHIRTDGKQDEFYDLTLEQKNRLSWLCDDAPAALEQYKNNIWFKDIFPKMSKKIFARYNANVAKETLDALSGTVFDPSASDPKVIILELFAARKKLRAQASTTLLPAIDELLKKCYEHLLQKVPEDILQNNYKRPTNHTKKFFSNYNPEAIPQAAQENRSWFRRFWR